MQVLIGGPWNLAIYDKKLQYHILLETDPFLLKSFQCSSSGFFRSFDCMMGQVLGAVGSQFSPLCVLWLHNLPISSLVSEKQLSILLETKLYHFELVLQV